MAVLKVKGWGLAELTTENGSLSCQMLNFGVYEHEEKTDSRFSVFEYLSHR